MKTLSHGAVMYLALSLIPHSATLAETPAAGQECTTLNARYTIEGTDEFELHFEKPTVPPLLFSDLHVVVTTPGKRYVFQFYSTSGYGTDYLEFLPELSDEVIVVDTAKGGPIYGFDNNFKLIVWPPNSDTPAAQHYFTPDLGLLFTYHLREGKYLPREMWNLTSCS